MRRRLLLVEDDRATYSALRGILTIKGWEVTVATSVADGMAAITPGGAPYDAVVLDLMLPDGDGEAILAQVRRQFGRSLPVVVTTGVSDAQRLGAVTQMAPAALLRKPIRLADLLNAIGGVP